VGRRAGLILAALVSAQAACVEPPPYPQVLPRQDAETSAEPDARADGDPEPEPELPPDAKTEVAAETGPDIEPSCVVAACPAPGPCQGPAACDPSGGGCIYEPLDGTSCDDGDPCTLPDVCEIGVCASAPKDCSGADSPCFVGECNPTTGFCVPEPSPDGVACEDNDPCTATGKCAATKCEAPPKSCSDFNPCTIDSCDPSAGACKHADIGTGSVCDDGNPCTIGDTCNNAACVGVPRRDLQVEWRAAIAPAPPAFGVALSARALAVHSDGSVGLAGSASVPVKLSIGLQSAGFPFEEYEDGFVAHLSPAGAIAWTRSYAGPGQNQPAMVLPLAGGSSAVVGYASAPANLGPPEAPVTLPDSANAFVAAYDPTGSLQWSSALGPYAIVSCAAHSVNGDVFAAGSTGAEGSVFNASNNAVWPLSPPAGAQALAFVARYSSTGLPAAPTPLAKNTAAMGSDVHPIAVAAGPNGRTLVLLRYRGDVELAGSGGDAIPVPAAYALVLGSWDSVGALEWWVTLDSDDALAAPLATSLVVAGDGGVLIARTLDGSMTTRWSAEVGSEPLIFEGGDPEQTSVGLLVLTPSGGLAWDARLLNGWSVSVSVAGTNTEVVSGFSGAGYWLDDGTATRFASANGTGLVTRFEQDGKLLTVAQFAGSAGSFHAVASDAAGGAVIAGSAFAEWGVAGDLVDMSPASGVASAVMRITEPDVQACAP
jgi:hypothetical protein